MSLDNLSSPWLALEHNQPPEAVAYLAEASVSRSAQRSSILTITGKQPQGIEQQRSHGGRRLQQQKDPKQTEREHPSAHSNTVRLYGEDTKVPELIIVKGLLNA